MRVHVELGLSIVESILDDYEFVLAGPSSELVLDDDGSALFIAVLGAALIGY